ncbi:cbb3-type cytochrome oxidase assembly protein CcoS [Taylorella asinigenitalis]|uniref:cbb3-type cytochrome oxidase assembly protein CcoS n=1 Tax=Taylorella asinigenitalis TaxID=84590 RepID=UPI00224C5787|nr:cbb3-type cytochrome oxidase assembly protein CcoS [Taylorella asinigenitalis]
MALSFFFVVIVGLFLYWATSSGQFDDVQKHSTSILEDDDTQNLDVSQSLDE